MRTRILMLIIPPFLFLACEAGEKKGRTDDAKAKESEEYRPSIEELSSYIKAEEDIHAIRLRAKEDVVDVVMEQQLDMQRFRELDEAGELSELEDPATEEEKKALQGIRRKRKEIWNERKRPMKERAEAQGLKWRNYQRIRDALREEGAVQDRFREMSDSMGVQVPLPPKERPAHMP